MLNIQKYLENNTLLDCEKELGLVVSKYSDRIVLNYSQISSEKNHPIADECRGLILSYPELNILSSPFDRFYNLNEVPETKEDNINFFDLSVLEKLDGCVDYDTNIDTLEYGKIKIGYLVENNIKCHVKSFDVLTKEIVFKNIEGVSVKENNDDWYRLELENGRILEITGDHYIWIDNKKCWRQVKDLETDDEVLLDKN